MRMLIAALLLAPGLALAADAPAQSRPAHVVAVHDADVQAYIDAITQAARDNPHACFGDSFERDEDLNADTGITPEILESLLNPPQS